MYAVEAYSTHQANHLLLQFVPALAWMPTSSRSWTWLDPPSGLSRPFSAGNSELLNTILFAVAAEVACSIRLHVSSSGAGSAALPQLRLSCQGWVTSPKDSIVVELGPVYQELERRGLLFIEGAPWPLNLCCPCMQDFNNCN